MAAWKTIRITRPCTLRLDNDNLVVEDNDNRVKLSLPDTDSIIFEGDRFMVSAKVLSALSRHKVATLFCDESYMPSAILHPYHQSSLATETLKEQLAMTDRFKDLLWAEIIKVKIALQADVLKHFSKPFEKVAEYTDHIRPGDPYNAEAKSARIYWKKLFHDLKREPQSRDVRNQALNYAYAILRSLLTRDLSAAGFLPALGLWHDNRYNAFNLSDDLMEPLRPVVDAAVYLLLSSRKEEQLTSAFKRDIIGIFDKEYLIFQAGRSTFRSVSRRYIQGFKSSVRDKSTDALHYPDIDFERLRECF